MIYPPWCVLEMAVFSAGDRRSAYWKVKNCLEEAASARGMKRWKVAVSGMDELGKALGGVMKRWKW